MIDYFKTGSSIAVAKGNPDGYAVDNLCGKEVVVTKGSIQATKRLPELSKSQCEDQGKPAIQGIILPSIQDAMTQLASGRVKAIYYDTPSMLGAMTFWSDLVHKHKVLPAGESLVWSLAKENGTIAMSQRYPAEDGATENARMNKLGL